MSEQKYSILFFLLFCLLLAGYSAYNIRLSCIQEKEKAEIRVANTSFLIGEWIKGAFMASDYVLQDIIYSVPVSELEYPTTNPDEHAKFTKLIDEKHRTLLHASGVGLTNSDGFVTHTLSIVGFDANHREWFSVPKNNPEIETFVSNMFRSNNDELMVIQSRKFPGEEFSGLAGIGVNLNFFSTWLKDVKIDPHGVIGIADAKLSLLARKPAIPDALGKKVNDPIIEAFVSSDENYMTFQQQSPLDNEERLYGVRKVKELPFIIVVGEAKRDWLSGWYKQVIMALVMFFIGVGLSFVVLLFYWKQLSQKEALAALAMTDALTGLSNRSHLDKTLLHELVRSDRFSHSLGLIMLDIDHFKKINDMFGHQTGDKVLKEFAALLISSCRATETVGRWGGEEFLIICPLTDINGLHLLAENIRRKIEDHRFPDVYKVTASLGITCRVVNESIEQAIGRADEALYRAKIGGRNLVCAA
jgi:diguanylate cyclase (GGDEF)-like protein